MKITPEMITYIQANIQHQDRPDLYELTTMAVNALLENKFQEDLAPPRLRQQFINVFGENWSNLILNAIAIE